jgi:hypothetical protein
MCTRMKLMMGMSMFTGSRRIFFNSTVNIYIIFAILVLNLLSGSHRFTVTICIYLHCVQSFIVRQRHPRTNWVSVALVVAYITTYDKRNGNINVNRSVFSSITRITPTTLLYTSLCGMIRYFACSNTRLVAEVASGS